MEMKLFSDPHSWLCPPGLQTKTAFSFSICDVWECPRPGLEGGPPCIFLINKQRRKNKKQKQHSTTLTKIERKYEVAFIEISKSTSYLIQLCSISRGLSEEGCGWGNSLLQEGGKKWRNKEKKTYFIFHCLCGCFSFFRGRFGHPPCRDDPSREPGKL